MIKLDLKTGMSDIKSKSEDEIEQAAGMSWGARAAACYVLVVKTTDKLTKLKYLIRAEDNRHEALEHAALAGDGGKFVNELQKELDAHRSAALKSIT